MVDLTPPPPRVVLLAKLRLWPQYVVYGRVRELHSVMKIYTHVRHITPRTVRPWWWLSDSQNSRRKYNVSASITYYRQLARAALCTPTWYKFCAIGAAKASRDQITLEQK
jgi:hypothetical protein